MNNQPEEIGDLIELVVTWQAPAGTNAVITAANMLTRDPAGAEVVVSGDELSENTWHFIAAGPINLSGLWAVRINATAGMIDSFEFSLDIARSRFQAPLAVP